MRVWLPLLFSFGLLCGIASASEAAGEGVDVEKPATAVETEAPAAGDVSSLATAGEAIGKVYVIPVREQIGSAVFYVIRRGLKEAIEQKADVVVFDMHTPGGALDKTLKIMEAISRFPGTTITFVNTDAISAGAFIAAATDEIWFAPRGKMGAAAPVAATGQEIEKSMREKIVSYLGAEVRSLSEGKGYRGEVVSAMMDEDYELKIGEEVLKPKGKLLTLTASEAAKRYGEPPQSLLSAGTVESLDELIATRFSTAKPAMIYMRLTWSEKLAVLLNAISPVLLGLGMLALFIEFKTPGFGIFGIVGIACLGLVFLGNYVAGISGHEPIVIFAVGLLLVAAELFFFPGTVVLAGAGLLLMLGSLVWSMADSWPKEAVPVAWSADLLVGPLANLLLGVAIAVALGVALARYLPRGWVWDRLVLGAAVAANARGENVAPATAASTVETLEGRRGVAVTALRPGGHVEIEGRRYEASVEVGALEAGTPVVVRRQKDFGLIVEKADA